MKVTRAVLGLHSVISAQIDVLYSYSYWVGSRTHLSSILSTIERFHRRLILKAPVKTSHDTFHSVAHSGSRWRPVRAERSRNGLQHVGALPVSFRDEERFISLGRGYVFLLGCGGGGGGR
jgi:hypothetical protein